ncbi:hypothetical protein [Burkholderia contaminans]|uniref:hypothetical protein n=1 Tax=Burkholderia contaminans TaxID=488447 RepID=UPI001F1382FA|nr:hypothetical protein [Burkholderia contaminans]UMY33409.1 hypothetical protein MMB18_38455 [Burkholderia contaminans]
MHENGGISERSRRERPFFNSNRNRAAQDQDGISMSISVVNEIRPQWTAKVKSVTGKSIAKQG